MDSVEDWIDLYVVWGKELTLQKFASAINEYVLFHDDKKSLYEKFGKIPQAEPLTDKFGRFTFENKILYFVQPKYSGSGSGNAILENAERTVEVDLAYDLSIGVVEDSVLGRVRGKIIPSAACYQLILLLGHILAINGMIPARIRSQYEKIYTKFRNYENLLILAVDRGRDAANLSLST